MQVKTEYLNFFAVSEFRIRKPAGKKIIIKQVLRETGKKSSRKLRCREKIERVP